MAERRFSLVVFDWDGTLMDSAAAIVQAIQAACCDIGYPEPTAEAARYVIGLGLADALGHVTPGLDAAGQRQLVERYRFHYLARDPEIVLFAGIPELLAELDERGVMLAIATGKSRAGLDRVLRQTGLSGRFLATRCADEGFSKPHPDMLLHLMDRTGADPAATVMIGDTTHDLMLARNAGIAGVAVTYGAHPIASLQAFEPLAVVDTVEQLRSWLLQNV